jgi:hypothetical protein
VTDTFQWERCAADGTACTDITGETASTYLLTTDDVGHTIRAAGARDAVAAATSAPTPLIAAASAGTPFWSDGFETGTFAAWDDVTQGFHNAVVTDGSANGGPTSGRAGTDFYQSELHSGDSIPAAGSGERCEIIKGSIQAINGDERWYGWSSWWPSVMPLSDGTNVRTVVLGQFHSNSGETLMNQANMWIVNAPNLAGVNFSRTTAAPGFIFGINGGDPTMGGQRLNINTQTGGASGHPFTSYAIDIGPATTYRGVGWVDWKVHVVWHDAGHGLAELYRRLPGEGSYTLVAQLLNCSTLYRGYSAYCKLGAYRTPTPSAMGVGYAWYDAVAFGDTAADVEP